jgi:hypothetical protein
MRPNLSGRLLAAVIAAIILPAAAPAQTPARPAPAATPSRPAATPTRPAPPSAESLEAGKALLAKVVEGLGGSAKARGVRDVQTKGQITARTPQGDMTMEIQTALIIPDHLSQQVDAPFGRLAMIATPAGAFMVGPNGSQDLPDHMRDELLRQVQRLPLHLAQKVDDPKLVAAAAGTEKIGEVDAGILDVRYGEMTVRWFVDPKTGRILRTAHSAVGPDGKSSSIVSDYSDYRVVDGFPVAHRLEVTTNGEKDQTLILEECRFNAGADAKLFEKPPPMPTPAATPAAPPPG